MVGWCTGKMEVDREHHVRCHRRPTQGHQREQGTAKSQAEERQQGKATLGGSKPSGAGPSVVEQSSGEPHNDAASQGALCEKRLQVGHHH